MRESVLEEGNQGSHYVLESFLNCLSRFLARRDRCREICSDNGTNFVGAWKELNRIRRFLQEKEKSVIT